MGYLSPVHAREVFKGAILASACSILVAHNHPSGYAGPSEADLSVTRRLIEAGNLLQIPVLDHVIVGDAKFTSLRDDDRGCSLPWEGVPPTEEQRRYGPQRRRRGLAHQTLDAGGWGEEFTWLQISGRSRKRGRR